MVMIRVLLFAVLLSINLATISRAAFSECARIFHLASVRPRWTLPMRRRSATTTPNRALRSNHLHDIESAGPSRVTKDLMVTVRLALI
jgi:hypothetical protein